MIDTLKTAYEEEKERAVGDLKSQYFSEIENIRQEMEAKYSGENGPI